MNEARKPSQTTPLRRGWTTGACATAATKAALSALLTGEFPDPVQIVLPKGDTPSFALCHEKLLENQSVASIIKDAGDDPDVTHGAEIVSRVRFGETGSGITFLAGEGVGTVTKAGLPLAVGEPAINPVPRQLMRDVVEELCHAHGTAPDIIVEISIVNGAQIAKNTWNQRLGIVGGLSVLGTTGVVHPFSCSAWIHSIHRGVDVARAAGLTHIAGSTGSTSEDAVQKLYDLPDIALMDMGDFAGGLLKYVANHPLSRLTIAGGFAKMVKLAQGALDLHSARSQVDFDFLAQLILSAGGPPELATKARAAGTALEVLELSKQVGIHSDLAQAVAKRAEISANIVLEKRGAPVSIDILVVGRSGIVLANTANAV